MYNTGNIVRNYVITLVTDGNWTYHGDHIVMYRNVKALCCAPGSEIGNERKEDRSQERRKGRREK